jgi:hypothetical protein
MRLQLGAIDRVERIAHRHSLAEPATQRDHCKPFVETAPALRRPPVDDLSPRSFGKQTVHHQGPLLAGGVSQF